MRRPSLLSYAYLCNGTTIEKQRTKGMLNSRISKPNGVSESTSTMVGLPAIPALIWSACSVSANTPNITAATMTQEQAGENPPKVSPPSDTTF